jgi:hypothetical protein
MTSLYRLDQHASTGAGKADLGPLPDTAVTLLAVLGVAWLCIAAYVLNEMRKEKKKKREPIDFLGKSSIMSPCVRANHSLFY